MKSKFTLGARRASKLTAVALIGAMATCTDEPTAPKLTTPPIRGPLADVAPTADPVTHTLLTSGKSGSNQKGYTTASISPAPNALVLLAVLGHRAYGANPSPVVSGGGMAAWEEVATVTLDPLSDPLKRVTLYRAMSASPGSEPITIRFENTVSNAQWVVSQWKGVDISGTNGAGAIVQTASARADLVNGLTVTLAPFESANNVAYGAFAVRSKVLAVTPGSGFTEVAEEASVESPLSDLQAEWAANDNTVDASWVNLNGAAIGVEIRAAGAPPPAPVVSPSTSTVAAAPSSIPVGTGSSTITVTVKYENGAPISGATVVLSATGDGNTLTQPTAPTDASGKATGTLGSTVAGTKIVSATANGTAITQTATVEVTEAPPPTTQPLRQTLLTSGNNTVNQKVYATASISPAPNALVTLAVMGHSSYGASPSPVVTGGGMTAWEQVATVTFDPIGTPLKRITVYRAMSASPGSGPITISFQANQSHAQWVVSQWEGVDVSGTNGAGAIVQTASARADAANGLTMELAPLADPNNAAYGVFGVRSKVPVVTPGSGFTEIAEQASAESPLSDLQAEWAANDNSVDATWANLNGGALGVEIRAGVDPVTSVTVDPPSATIVAGETVQLTATAENAQGEPLPGRPTTWSTDAPSVATVSSAGLVTGQGEGSATITATSEGKSGTSSVTVTVPVASVEVTPASASITVGGTVQLTATAKDDAGNVLNGRTLVWSSDAPSVATVSSTGLVTGNAAGSATITATSEGKSGTSSITVTSAPVVALEPASAPLGVAVAPELSFSAASGGPWSYKVEWGDGKSSTGVASAPGPIAVSHVYPALGTYAAVATVTDAAGKSGTDPADMTVVRPADGSVVLAAGDIADCGRQNRDELTAQILDREVAATPTATVMTIGDNAYPDGTAADYANCYAPTWGRHKARTYAAIGNREYALGNATATLDYFGDRVGKPGTHPSCTPVADTDPATSQGGRRTCEGYYSIDVGDWHVVVLNDNLGASVSSLDDGIGSSSGQLAWLRDDLTASKKKCQIVLWHQPRYMSSDDTFILRATRKAIWDRLYAAGVEIALNAHQHFYERHYPMNPDGVRDDAAGVLQLMVGTGGESTGDVSLHTFISPNSAARSSAFGVIKFTFYANAYEWEFLPASGDTFTDSGSGVCH